MSVWDSGTSGTECNITDCLLQCYTCYSVTFVTDEIYGTVSQVSRHLSWDTGTDNIIRESRIVCSLSKSPKIWSLHVILPL